MVKRGEFLEQYSVLTKRLRAMIAAEYAALGIGASQGKLIRRLSRDVPMSQADLARATDTAPALLGRSLDTLVKRGWIKRTRSTEDRRQYLLTLTPAGEKIWAKVDAARTSVMDRIAEALDDRDVSDFQRISKRLLAAFPAPSS